MRGFQNYFRISFASFEFPAAEAKLRGSFAVHPGLGYSKTGGGRGWERRPGNTAAPGLTRSSGTRALRESARYLFWDVK